MTENNTLQELKDKIPNGRSGLIYPIKKEIERELKDPENCSQRCLNLAKEYKQSLINNEIVNGGPSPIHQRLKIYTSTGGRLFLIGLILTTILCFGLLIWSFINIKRIFDSGLYIFLFTIFICFTFGVSVMTINYVYPIKNDFNKEHGLYYTKFIPEKEAKLAYINKYIDTVTDINNKKSTQPTKKGGI